MFLLPLGATATVAGGTKEGLIKPRPGVYMSFSCVFNTTPTLAIKPHSFSVSPFTAASPGEEGALRDTVRRVTRALTTGVTRGSSHFTEVQESHKASGGIYEGGGKAEVKGGGGVGFGVGAEGASQDAVDAPAPLKRQLI